MAEPVLLAFHRQTAFEHVLFELGRNVRRKKQRTTAKEDL